MELAIDATKLSDDDYWGVAITMASYVARDRFRAAETARISLVGAGVDLGPGELASTRHFDRTVCNEKEVYGYRLPGGLFASTDGPVLYEPDPEKEVAERYSNYQLARVMTSLSPNDKQYLLDELVAKVALLA